VLREYIVSEAMAALGIPTTRALAVVTTGEMVWRETPLPGAVLTRVALSHVRVGTFQFFAARGDVDAVQRLADHVIARHYPEAVDAANPYRTLLDLVISRQAELVAKWLLVGFIHGVMNTDNMSIAGETIDYGPCAFMDVYHAGTVFSSIDTLGRYAYGNQPAIAQWNLARFAETLLPLLAKDKDAAIKEAQEAIETFAIRFETAYAAGLSRKLGLLQPRPDDLSLAQDLLGRMARNDADFTLTFRRLCDSAVGCHSDEAVRGLFANPSAFDDWATRWRHRLAEEGGERTPGGDACRQPCFHPAQPSGGGGDLCCRERRDFLALRGPADGALHALRGSTCVQPLRRSAAARSSRAPNVLWHLTMEGEGRVCGPFDIHHAGARDG
jgi:uncharacterized protein YdiU (UPF0061 family)